MLGGLRGAEQEPHGFELDGSTEVHLVVQLAEAFEVRKYLGDGNLRGPVDDQAYRGGTEVVHHQHDRVGEIRIAQVTLGDEKDGGQRLRIVRGRRPRCSEQEQECSEPSRHLELQEETVSHRTTPIRDGARIPPFQRDSTPSKLEVYADDPGR